MNSFQKSLKEALLPEMDNLHFSDDHEMIGFKSCLDIIEQNIDKCELDEESIFIPILTVVKPDIAYLCRPDGTTGKTFTNKRKIREIIQTIKDKVSVKV